MRTVKFFTMWSLCHSFIQLYFPSFCSKKLQHLRKVQPVYSRSGRGFSLHRSGLLGLSGANLKWSKSIERRSKQASEVSCAMLKKMCQIFNKPASSSFQNCSFQRLVKLLCLRFKLSDCHHIVFLYQEATKAVAAVEKQQREKKEAESGGVKIAAKSNARKRELRQSPYRSKFLCSHPVSRKIIHLWSWK